MKWKEYFKTMFWNSPLMPDKPEKIYKANTASNIDISRKVNMTLCLKQFKAEKQLVSINYLL